MNREEKRLYLIRSLLDKQPAYRKIKKPADPAEQKHMLCSLFNGPDGITPFTTVPAELLPICPVCGEQISPLSVPIGSSTVRRFNL